MTAPDSIEIVSCVQIGGAVVVTARAVGGGRTATAFGTRPLGDQGDADATCAAILAAEELARERATRLLAREPDPIPPSVPAGPVPMLKPAPDGWDVLIEGDPRTDAKALSTLAARKGYNWPDVIKDLNKRFGTAHGITSTLWLKVKREHRHAAVAALEAMPDCDPSERTVTADEVMAAFAQVARLSRLTTIEEAHRWLTAARIPIPAMMDDLTQEQLRSALKSATAKLDALRRKAADPSKPAA